MDSRVTQFFQKGTNTFDELTPSQKCSLSSIKMQLPDFNAQMWSGSYINLFVVLWLSTCNNSFNFRQDIPEPEVSYNYCIYSQIHTAKFWVALTPWWNRIYYKQTSPQHGHFSSYFLGIMLLPLSHSFHCTYISQHFWSVILCRPNSFMMISSLIAH